ncbi:MAG: hypothetical protein EXR70_22260 [Deltaproteobacteria bacterium]|nr:hypothetical protein [Deltaproteobacteria bacterium]
MIIRGLNPQIKNIDTLRIGDKVFIPLRSELLARGAPASAAAERPQPGKGTTNLYRVKAGEHLYQILREQLKLTDDRKVPQYYVSMAERKCAR